MDEHVVPPRPPEKRDRKKMSEQKMLAGLMKFLTVGLVLFGLLGGAVFVAGGLIIVDAGEAAILIRKTGDDLPNGQILASGEGQKGIQPDPLPEGWHWKNPYSWDHEIIQQLEIRQGEVGIKVKNYGSELPTGRVIARIDQKGIQPETLRPGRYLINSRAFQIHTSKAVKVDAGFVGVVTLLSGTDPKDPNEFLVETGERGVQKATLPPGTYYPNPFVEKIVPVEVRSHRFDMMQENQIQFPSVDGFTITMEGTIEWYIDKERAAEVYVKYVDNRDVITCAVEKIILPYARAFSRIEGSKHLAKDFIRGETRQQFQDKFAEGLKIACAQEGVVINSALVRKTIPPEEIRTPIRMTEIAERNRTKYLDQQEREKEQKVLSMQEKMKERKQMVKVADADVSVGVTLAKQRKEVALIEASRQLDVARLDLEAAKNQAAAIKARGQAKADVIVYNNAAEAQGIRESVAAFGDGRTFVRYLMNEKLAPSISQILSNTDGPFTQIFQQIVNPTAGQK